MPLIRIVFFTATSQAEILIGQTNWSTSDNGHISKIFAVSNLWQLLDEYIIVIHILFVIDAIDSNKFT